MTLGHHTVHTQAYIESLSGINLYDVRTFQGYEFIDQVTPLYFWIVFHLQSSRFTPFIQTLQAIANWAADPMTKARFNLPQNASWKNADQVNKPCKRPRCGVCDCMGYSVIRICHCQPANHQTKPYRTAHTISTQYAAAAGDALKNDLMMSYAPQVAAILDKYKASL